MDVPFLSSVGRWRAPKHPSLSFSLFRGSVEDPGRLMCLSGSYPSSYVNCAELWIPFPCTSHRCQKKKIPFLAFISWWKHSAVPLRVLSKDANSILSTSELVSERNDGAQESPRLVMLLQGTSSGQEEFSSSKESKTSAPMLVTSWWDLPEFIKNQFFLWPQIFLDIQAVF